MADGGHSFGKKTFHKPTYCHHCSDLLWGLIGQGYICEVCNFIVHERCVCNVVTPCTGIAPFIIKNPVAHCWSEPIHHKRKFCTVCRKRLDETPAVHCMICEYFAHIECQDFAVPDCKEHATYVPGKELTSVKHTHHWREGNLPQTSKCACCKKTCWSSECLTGYRCEWCGMTTHGGCRTLLTNDCTFGVLQPIYLPPHAVSIPRTEVPMEAIIGVQTKAKITPLQRDYSCPELRTIGLCDASSENVLCVRHLPNMIADHKETQYLQLLFLPAYPKSPSKSANRCASQTPEVQRQLSSSESIVSLNSFYDISGEDAISLYSQSNLVYNLNNQQGASVVSKTTAAYHNNNNESTVYGHQTIGTHRDSNASSLSNSANQLSNETINLKYTKGTVRLNPQKQRPQKYYSALNRIRNESVTRSKSFQEQGVKPLMRNSRFFVNRHLSRNDSVDTVSQTIEITVQNEDGVVHVPATDGDIGSDDEQPYRGRVPADSRSVTFGQYDSGSQGSMKSGHILGRILRRMRKISSMLRRKSRSISEEFSSGGDQGRQREDEFSSSKQENTTSNSSHRNEGTGHKSEKDGKDLKRDKDKEEKDEETIKVFDGNYSLRRRIFRPITVPRTCSVDQLLTASLRALHITRDSSKFYITDLYAPGSEEVRCQDPHPVINLHRIEGKRPSIYLRFRDKENDKGFVRVYPGKLQLQIEDPFVNVSVDNDSNVSDLVRSALNQFGLHDNAVDDYRCSEVLLDRGVTERILSWSERPWEIMKQLGKDSIRQMELMRFYMQHKQDPHGSSIALFIGNLPQALSQRNYETIITKQTTEENKYSSIGPIYYEYGSVVITFEDAAKAVRAFYILRESVVEEKKLQVLLLPNIEPSMVPAGVQPLLVFVNVKSGGCQGLELISSFRKLLNPYQVFDLDNGGPLPGLYVFRHIQDYKILVCGGDGTIGWVLQCLDNVGQDSECCSPPCAIVPLGTGNDLARVLRWGPGYTGGEDPLNLLRDVIDAEEIRLDRWTVVFHPEDKPEESAQKAPPNATGKKKKKVHQAQKSQKQQHQQLQQEQQSPHQIPIVVSNSSNQTQVTGATQSEDNSQMLVMNNYFGIGIDADLCLDFHNAREENPNKFNSRLHNKGVYVKMGLRKMVGRKTVKELHKELRLEVDGKVVDLPPVEGIIILNILSWGSGANPWGPDKEDQFSTPNHWDGMLEVVGVSGVVHLGQIQSGLRQAVRIAQGGHIKIHSHSDIPVQVDGEPWIQPPGDVVVFNSALKATMLKKLKGKMKRRNTEPTMHMTAGSSGAGGGNLLALTIVPTSETDENDSNNTDF